MLQQSAQSAQPSSPQVPTHNLSTSPLKELAKQVRPFDGHAATRLERLDLAVEKGIDADAWAACDIHKIIDPAGIVERFKQLPITDTIVQAIEWIRNTFIFAPIVITWFSISQATQKYNELITPAIQRGDQNLASQPFLYLWQGRFGGTLPDWLTLSSVALIDAVLLFVILALTILAYSLSSMRGAARERQARQLRSDLDNALANAMLSLHGRPKAPLTAGDNLEKVAQQFDTASRNISAQLTAMMQQLSSQFSTMTQQITARFEGIAQQVTTRFDNTAQQVTARIDIMAQQTGSRLDGIAQRMHDQVQEGGKYLSTLGSLTAGTVQVAKEMQTTAAMLSTSTTALADNVKGLIGPVDILSKQQALLLDAAQHSVQQLQNTSQAMGTIVTQQQKWGTELNNVLDALNLAVEDAVKLGRNVGDFVSQQGTLFQHIQNAYDTQNRLAVIMSDATNRVKESLDSMQSGAVSMRSMARDMYDMLRMVATIPSMPGGQTLVNGLSSANEYQAAAAAIEQGAATLNASAIAMHRASQQLADLLEDWQEERLQQTQHP